MSFKKGLLALLGILLGWELAGAQLFQSASDAQYYKGLDYYMGYGVRQDLEEAARLFRQAADDGHAKAQQKLGVMLYEGKGVTKDETDAFRYISRAAEQGNGDAMDYLCRIHANGKGNYLDLVLAYKWCSLAISRGESGARYFRDRFAEFMSQGQIDAALSLARSWKPSR